MNIQDNPLKRISDILIKEDSHRGMIGKLLTSEKLDALNDIAYCATGMLNDINENNQGDADKWRRHLSNALEKLRDEVDKT